MYAIPQLMAFPALSAFGVTAFDWPMIGAFLAWTLIAACVGTGLGALRRMTSPSSGVVPRRSLLPDAAQTHAHLHADHDHLQAA